MNQQVLLRPGTPVQIPTRIPEKIVVAIFSGILVNSGIVVVAGTFSPLIFRVLPLIFLKLSNQLSNKHTKFHFYSKHTDCENILQ